MYSIQQLIKTSRSGYGDPTGEANKGALRLDFDRRLLLQFRGSTITSDAGLLAYRELDDTLGLTDMGADTLADARTGKNDRHRQPGLLSQSVFGRLAGYEEMNDADRLCRDPAMRWVVGDRAITGSAASASQMGRFETKWLSRPENLAALADLPGQWINKLHPRRPPKTIVLEMDSSESSTYGEKEGSAYNGHFGCTYYHRRFVFNQLGDVERCALRPGNVHSAGGWRALLEPVVARYRGTVKRLYFQGDAAFANPVICEFLEAEGAGYRIRLPANSVLQSRIGYLLRRPVGRPPHEVRRHFASFGYQAKSWSEPRRVVSKAEWHPGELYPRLGFIVTSLARQAERVVAFYNQRGTAEQWIKEGKGAIKWTRLSCRTFAANAVRLQLHALAYNLGNFMRTLAMPKMAQPWSLTSLREKLINIGAKITSHGQYVTFQMAEVAVPREMFADMLVLIARMRAPPASMRGQRGENATGDQSSGMLIGVNATRLAARCTSTVSFNRLLPALSAICRCPSRSKARSWRRNRRESGECRLKCLHTAFTMKNSARPGYRMDHHPRPAVSTSSRR